MSVMTEEEMDYQIELNEIYSNKNDNAENLYEFTESELSVHDKRIRADERKKFAEWIMFFVDGYYFKSADEILSDYEKHLKGED